MDLGSNLLKRRWSTTVVLVVLATASLVATVAGRWTHDVLFDTETWVEIVGPIGTSAEMTATLSEYVSGELIDWVDAENRMENLLPPALARLAALVAPFVNDLITEETEGFFNSDIYEQAWLGINERAHAAVVAVIRDQVPFISTEGGVVTVDLVPLLTPIVDRTFDRLTELGEAIPPVILSQVDIDETVAGIIQAYEEEGLPDRFSDIEVYSSDRLAAIQQATAMFDRLIWVLPVLTLLFAAGAIYFAPNRWMVGAVLLGAAAVGWLVAGLAVTLIVNNIVSGIDSATAGTVANEVLTGMTSGLTNLLVILGVVAGALAIGLGVWLYRTEEREATISPVSGESE